jgi:hypothetical protein
MKYKEIELNLGDFGFHNVMITYTHDFHINDILLQGHSVIYSLEDSYIKAIREELIKECSDQGRVEYLADLHNKYLKENE